MEPLLKDKRDVAALMAYRGRGDDMEFYLQKREPTRRVLPNMFTMFGGGIEGEETPEEGCLREIKEELNYVPQHMRYFTRYESADAVVHVFMEEVGSDFEKQVTVLEGEYGQFISRREIRGMPKVALLAQLAALQICQFLQDGSIPS